MALFINKILTDRGFTDILDECILKEGASGSLCITGLRHLALGGNKFISVNNAVVVSASRSPKCNEYHYFSPRVLQILI